MQGGCKIGCRFRMSPAHLPRVEHFHVCTHAHIYISDIYESKNFVFAGLLRSLSRVSWLRTWESVVNLPAKLVGAVMAAQKKQGTAALATLLCIIALAQVRVLSDLHISAKTSNTACLWWFTNCDVWALTQRVSDCCRSKE